MAQNVRLLKSFVSPELPMKQVEHKVQSVLMQKCMDELNVTVSKLRVFFSKGKKWKKSNSELLQMKYIIRLNSAI